MYETSLQVDIEQDGNVMDEDDTCFEIIEN